MGSDGMGGVCGVELVVWWLVWAVVAWVGCGVRCGGVGSSGMGGV